MITGIRDKGHEINVFRPAQKSDSVSKMNLALDSITGLSLTDLSGLSKDQDSREVKGPEYARAESNRAQPEPETLTAFDSTLTGTGSDGQHLSLALRMPFYREVQVGLASPHFFRSRFRRQRPDLVHIVTEGPLGFNALLAARSCGIPVISDYRTHFDQYFEYYGMPRLGRRVAWYLRLFHNLTRRTLVPTEAMRSELMAAGYKRVSVIGRGVDLDSYSPAHRSHELRKSLGVRNHGLLVLYAGRLAPEKNIDLAIESFREIQKTRPDARMLLVGDGPERSRLQQENPDLHFTGFLSGESLSRHYASSDVFLFPSLTDTFGNVVTEAAASGLAILAYDRGAARQLLENDHSALIAPGMNREGFLLTARKLASLAENSSNHQAFEAAFLRNPSRAPGNIPDEVQSPGLQSLKLRAREAACCAGWDSVVDKLEEVYFDALVKKVRFRNLVQSRMRKPQFQ
tara:strand:+ start:52490 stop:53863 length:1374 start_codon:yes stop_codon:yes gene_type:complete